MKFVKDFKNNIKQPLSLILIIISSTYLFYYNFPTGNFWRMMITIMPMLLVIASAILLQFKDKTLAAHGVLFFSGYLNGVMVFGRRLLSYNFAFKSMVPFGTLVESFFFMIISLYLLIVIVSYVLNKDYTLECKKSEVRMSILIAFLYFFIRDGFSLALLKIISPVIALMFGYEFISVLLLLAGVIEIPFDIIDDIYSKIIKFNTIHDFVFWAFGLYLLVTAVLALIKMLDNPFNEVKVEKVKSIETKEEDVQEEEEEETEDETEEDK